jgi:hypothetical protein
MTDFKLGFKRAQPVTEGEREGEDASGGAGANRNATSRKCSARQTGVSGTNAASSALPGGSTHCTAEPLAPVFNA